VNARALTCIRPTPRRRHEKFDLIPALEVCGQLGAIGSSTSSARPPRKVTLVSPPAASSSSWEARSIETDAPSLPAERTRRRVPPNHERRSSLAYHRSPADGRRANIGTGGRRPIRGGRWNLSIRETARGHFGIAGAVGRLTTGSRFGIATTPACPRRWPRCLATSDSSYTTLTPAKRHGHRRGVERMRSPDGLINPRRRARISLRCTRWSDWRAPR
jgi:hypothetical protein